jgi:hypothetical protein
LKENTTSEIEKKVLQTDENTSAKTVSKLIDACKSTYKSSEYDAIRLEVLFFSKWITIVRW